MTEPFSISDSFEILLVEDSAADIRLIQAALQGSRIPYRLNVVMDGDSALRYLRREGEFAGRARPDLMLLDLYLPGRDGLGILRELKEDDELRRIPVIVLSGMVQANIDYDRLSHAARCIRKPTDTIAMEGIVGEIEDICFQIAHHAPYLAAWPR